MSRIGSSAPANRNDPCPCGSGKKYKKCCLGKRPAPARDAARTSKPDLQDLLRRAAADHNAGRLEPAAAGYRRVLEMRPKETRALLNLALIMRDLGAPEQGVSLLRTATQVAPRQPVLQAMLADMLYLTGELADAHAAAKRAIALDPKNADAHRVCALWHERKGEFGKALTAIRRAQACAPDDASAGLLLADLLVRTGDIGAARAELERIVETERNPEYLYRAWRQIGGVLDRLGEHEAAFEAFERGGRARAETPAVRRLDPDVWSRIIDAYERDFTPALLDRFGRVRDDLPAPIFLVGFPRSGTTMTEQILAALPGITTSDEADLVRRRKADLARLVDMDSDVPKMLERLDEAGVRELRRRYWDDVRASFGIEPGERRFVDKHPLNIIDLGFINVMFPEATITVVHRDPRDVCLSCFMQRFSLNEAMNNFLSWERTAEFYAEVMGLWRKQQPLLTLDCVEVHYEDLVGDLETQTRVLLDALGIDWDPAVLAFHETARERMISTPSFEAVTRQAHSSAVGRWRHYQAPMERVAERLQPFIQAFGYDEA